MSPRIVIAMGVSGSGKSRFGVALAQALGADFAEGDDLHPEANVAKMRAGIALTDADRWPWLDRIGAWLGAEAAAGRDAVASCSALRRIYRDRLRAACPQAVFVLLDADAQVLRDRVANRPGHFMPVSLLDSQLATLERPGADERALVLDSTRAVEANLVTARDWLAAG